MRAAPSPAPANPLTLRDYQREATLAIADARQRGVRRQLACVATALGKTIIFASLPKALSLVHGDIVAVIAHRDELLTQASEKFTRANPGVYIDVEKAAKRASPYCSAVIGSIQTLVGKRLAEFSARFKGRIALLIIDEAHRAAAPSYVALVDKLLADNSKCVVVGFTATPNRSDNRALQSVFEEIVFERNAQWGIEHGYLVAPRCFSVHTQTSLDGVETIRGDFDIGQLGSRVNNADRNSLIVSAYRQHTPHKKAIVFCASVAHATELAHTFASAGIRVASASAKTSKEDRQEILRSFRAGETRVLINVSLYTEGFDVPDTEVVILARPTQSTTVFQQAVGRILRPVEEVSERLGPSSTQESRLAAIASSRKPFGTILDIIDQSKRHRLISLPSLWGMPARFNLEGRAVTDVQFDYRKLHALAPRAAAMVTTYQEVLTKLHEVSLFSAEPVHPVVARHGKMLWRSMPGEIFRLSLSARMEGQDRGGQPIPNLRARLFEEMELAKDRQIGNTRQMAYEILNVDPKTVREIHEHLEIRPNMLGSHDVVSLINGAEQRIYNSVPLVEAFRRAEQWLREHHPSSSIHLLSTTAGWHQHPITENQRRYLVTHFKVPEDLIPETKGEASRLITQLNDRQRAGRRVL